MKLEILADIGDASYNAASGAAYVFVKIYVAYILFIFKIIIRFVLPSFLLSVLYYRVFFTKSAYQ